MHSSLNKFTYHTADIVPHITLISRTRQYQHVATAPSFPACEAICHTSTNVKHLTRTWTVTPRVVATCMDPARTCALNIPADRSTRPPSRTPRQSLLPLTKASLARVPPKLDWHAGECGPCPEPWSESAPTKRERNDARPQPRALGDITHDRPPCEITVSWAPLIICPRAWRPAATRAPGGLPLPSAPPPTHRLRRLCFLRRMEPTKGARPPAHRPKLSRALARSRVTWGGRRRVRKQRAPLANAKQRAPLANSPYKPKGVDVRRTAALSPN